MTAAVVHPRKSHTLSEYFAFEHNALSKHEFDNGQIIAMAGGSGNHSLISANLIRELGNALKGQPCRLYESNLRLGIPPAGKYVYPDASVICGPIQYDPADAQGQTALNPTVVIEVLSPSTERDDRGKKFDAYRDIASFREYVLVAQDAPQIETIYRQDDGVWAFNHFRGLKAKLHLRSLQFDVPLSEIYAGIEFPAQPA